MKTIWGLLIIVAFAFLTFGGLYDSMQQITVSNQNLGADSIEIADKYNIQYSNLSNYEQFNNDSNKPTLNFSSTDTNQIDAFFREYAEAKNNVNKFASALNFIFHIPEIVLLSLPFVSLGDTSLTPYLTVIWVMLTFIFILVIYKALRGGKIDNE